MPKLLQPILILVAVISVALGDVFIKKASQNQTLYHTFMNRYMFIGVLLYLVQILLFTWMFFHGWNLIIVGVMQTVFYAIVVFGAGHLIFKENLNQMQLLGLSMAFTGVIITNIYAK